MKVKTYGPDTGFRGYGTTVCNVVDGADVRGVVSVVASTVEADGDDTVEVGNVCIVVSSDEDCVVSVVVSSVVDDAVSVVFSSA